MADAASDRILAIEDDLDAQCNLRDILELDGYRFEAVSTLREATEGRDLSEFFALVLDRQLPDGLAEDSLPTIRHRAPQAGILIVTGYADLDATIAALRQGIDDYILKPIDPGALRASLIRIRKLREARERLIQSERLAAIGQMVSGIAHESRNLLQRISAAAESLQSRITADPDDVADLACIQRGCDGLTRLLNDLREYAAPIKLDRCRSNLQKVWQVAWMSLSHNQAEKHATLIECLDSQSIWCSIDVFRMDQVFRNLFDNALAACSPPAEITIRCERSQEGMLRVTVSDNGPGIPPGQLARIFEPFVTNKTRGTGLGLSIVRRILEAHGGTISVGSSPNGGAAFVLAIPEAAGDQSAAE